MKIYFHLCLEDFTNCYIVVNDDPSVKEAIIIDPGEISEEMINQIEGGGYKLSACLITHNHKNHVAGLETLMRIYEPKIYAADSEVVGMKCELIHGDGKMKLAGLDVDFFSVPGHSPDSMVYKIGNVLFTGDTLFAGSIGETSSQYSAKLLRNNINAKLLSQTNGLVLMPGHGPPSTLEAEREFNIDMD